MVVDLTYCRPVSHDRTYLADPIKILAGRIDPPAFNLRNGLMVAKRLKGTDKRSRREAEGYNDVYTCGVLAAEGFLQGYGLEVGAVLGTAEIPFWRSGAKEFVLPRPASVALREYVPGNLIYANGNKFVARRCRYLDRPFLRPSVCDVDLVRLCHIIGFPKESASDLN